MPPSPHPARPTGSAPPPQASAPAGRDRAVLVLGGRPYQPLAWWLDPVKALLFLILPIFCFASYFNRFNYWNYNATADFITGRTFALGLYGLGLLLAGVVLAKLAYKRRNIVSVIDLNRAVVVLRRVGWITIAAYVVLLGSVIVRPSLIVQLFRGSVSAGSELREALGRIPGVSSFIQFDMVYLALASTLVFLTGYKMPRRMWYMTIAIVLLTFARALLASERLALLEVMAAMFVIPVAYRWKPSLWRSLAPYLGALFVFILFAAGEYFRSWQYYQRLYDSYAEFIVQRFAGYFSTSLNNGAGTYLMYGQYEQVPSITSGWVTKFPVLGRFLASDKVTSLDQFLENFATPEFNNPGGPYAAFLDYPFFVASLFMLGVGLLIGTVYRAFENKSLVGLILYPAVFLGLTDLIRALYIVDTRTLPIFAGAIVTVYAIRPRQIDRQLLLRHMPQAQGEEVR